MTLQAQDTPIEKGTIKVLHLIDSGGLYGAEKMLLTLVAEQIKQGLEPMILSAGEKGIEDKAIEVEARRLGLPVKAWRMTPGLNLLEVISIVKWAKLRGVTVLHSHGYKFNILLSFFPKSVIRLPMLTTIHGYVNARKYSKMWLYEALDRIALTRLDHVFLVSGHMLNSPMLKAIESRYISVVPNGLPSTAEITTYNLEKDINDFIKQHKVNILIVGRLSLEKNITSAIKAMSRAKVRERSIGICVIGEGSLFDVLKEERDRLKLCDSVEFFGYRSGVQGAMAFFDALLMPSLTEGLPITLLEAMSAKLPIVAARVGGIPSVLKDGELGTLFDPLDVDQISRAILDIENRKEELEDKAEMAYRHFIKNYTSETMAESYSSVYNKYF
ncbi:glycosyltransferase family 4 protein [Marinobacter sp. BGYM27]|uniref:glycosyltransferase family 4 protein n=1 Tax=Marinobacter sp. BGYM27 TaxID=2975597 RepID=UPI0021A5A017|nr:glycosyltransferase family 4 protein [Marinobacter sp. BGYM27]MDG5499004.1 glycosyltransferase family 4 protein [Marinobacter sp. BGYM27]